MDRFGKRGNTDNQEAVCKFWIFRSLLSLASLNVFLTRLPFIKLSRKDAARLVIYSIGFTPLLSIKGKTRIHKY